MIQVCIIFDPKYHGEMEEGKRVEPASMRVRSPEGEDRYDYVGRSSWKDRLTFEEALSETFRIRIRVTSGAMKAATEADIVISFPSSQLVRFENGAETKRGVN